MQKDGTETEIMRAAAWERAYIDLPEQLAAHYGDCSLPGLLHVRVEFRWSEDWGRPRRSYPREIGAGRLRARLRTHFRPVKAEG